jgi:mono/diheme cytochrome c family protein
MTIAFGSVDNHRLRAVALHMQPSAGPMTIAYRQFPAQCSRVESSTYPGCAHPTIEPPGRFRAKIFFVMRRLQFLVFLPLLVLTAAQATRTASAADTSADEKAGAQLYRDKGCAQCHGANLEGTKKGPALADIRNDPAWPPEKITKQITDGGQKMPPFGESMTDQEVAQVVAYLRAKDRPAPPPK